LNTHYIRIEDLLEDQRLIGGICEKAGQDEIVRKKLWDLYKNCENCIYGWTKMKRRKTKLSFMCSKILGKTCLGLGPFFHLFLLCYSVLWI